MPVLEAYAAKALSLSASISKHFLNLLVRELPYIEGIFFTALDYIFTPRQIFRQLLLAFGIQIGLVTLQKLNHFLQFSLDSLSEEGRQKRKIQLFMARSSSFAEWQHHAQTLDKMLGYDNWRKEDKSSLYDDKVIRKRIENIKTMIKNKDVFDLIFRLRGGLARDQYGMQHEGLFAHAAAGTKNIVEEYNETVASALNFICDEQYSKHEVKIWPQLLSTFIEIEICSQHKRI